MKTEREIQRQYYIETASSYDEMHDDPEHDVALRYISKLLEMYQIASILDVGCGTGRGIKYFRQQHPAIEVQGIEPVQALIDRAVQKQGIPAESIVCGSGEALPFDDRSFDAVCEFAILHHVPNPNIVVREMLRVARKAVFISDSNRFGQGSLTARWIKLLLYKFGMWGLADFIRTRGKGYTITEGDGLAYSYSVFDSYKLLAEWADRIILIPTLEQQNNSWLHPLLTSSHILICAIKEK